MTVLSTRSSLKSTSDSLQYNRPITSTTHTEDEAAEMAHDCAYGLAKRAYRVPEE